MKVLMLALFFVISISSAAHADLNSLCEQVAKWTPGQPGPAVEDYKGEMKLVDFEFAQKHRHEKNWLLVDTRGDTERTEKGFFEDVISLRSGLKQTDSDDYNESTVLEKIKAQTKLKSLKHKDLKTFNYILFCNGEKCPKSASAGCKLRKLGVPASQVHILPISYTDLKAKDF